MMDKIQNLGKGQRAALLIGFFGTVGAGLGAIIGRELNQRKKAEKEATAQTIDGLKAGIENLNTELAKVASAATAKVAKVVDVPRGKGKGKQEAAVAADGSKEGNAHDAGEA